MRGRDTPPGEDDAISGVIDTVPDAPDWAKMARDAYDVSTDWINASRTAKWGDNLRMFQGRHPAGSKYDGTEYRYRSRLFRPKTRSMVRKAEAATAQAFFSTENVVSITAENEDDPAQLASARLKQELLNYRLTRSIPWFLILNAARQDCEVYGICVSRQFWKYEERLIGTRSQPMTSQFDQAEGDDQGFAAQDTYEFYQVVADHPEIELIAPDNFRFDPACDWTRPVESSPYLIQRIPMYVGEVKQKMQPQPSGAPAEWNSYDDSVIAGSGQGRTDEATRLNREHGRQDSRMAQPALREFDVAWVHLNTMRWRGTDYVFFTLGPDRLLTQPRPHVEVYGTDRRPYRVGFTNLEAHRNYPAGNIELVRDLQSQANDTANLRLDGMKLALQPYAKIKQNSPAANNKTDFRVFAPGRDILVNDADDVTWDRPPEPTQAALAEQDRLNVDFDEIAGSFSQSSVQTNRQLNETVGGMELISGAAGTIGEYQLRLFKETWVIGVLEDLIDLEERLEEDELVLALAGTKAKLFQEYGYSQIDDWLMSQKVVTKVDVGIGATNPSIRLNALMTGAQIIEKLFGDVAGAGLVWDEVCGEVFGALGFSEGKRFFQPGFDPHLARMQMAQAQTIPGVDPNKMQEVQAQNQAKVQVAEIQAASAERVAAMKNTPPGVTFDPVKLHIEQFKAENAARIAGIQADSDQRIAATRLMQEREKQAAETARQVMQNQAHIQGHVIRTVPAAMAKLIVPRPQRASA